MNAQAILARMVLRVQMTRICSTVSVLLDGQDKIAVQVKGRSHYNSDNQSPTSNNHYFWGGCRRLSEVGKCLSMIGDWLSENYIDNLSPTSDNHPFSGWFSMVGKWLLMIAEQFWSARGFRCSINNHRQPNKAAIQNEYTFDPEKCR